MKRPQFLSYVPALTATVLVLCVLLLLLASCTDPVDWSDYSGVNLIAERNFDAVDAASNEPLWYFADGLTGNAGTAADPDFVTFEEVDSGVYGTLPAGATGPVYRYEIVNLLANGDFESTAAPAAPAGWVSSGLTAAATDATEPITGNNSLSLDFELPTNRYSIDLSTYLAGGFPADVLFAFHIDFRMPVSTFGMDLDNTTTGSVQGQWQINRGDPISEAVVYRYPGAGLLLPASFNRTNSFMLDPDYPTRTFFSFGGLTLISQERTEGLFDSFRIVRADQGHYLRLSVPFTDNLDPTRPELKGGGTYTITVWAKPDPTAGTGNRIAARLFSAGLDTSTGNPAYTLAKTTTVYTDGPTNLEALADWQQLSFAVSGRLVDTGTATTEDEVLFDVVFEIGHYVDGSEYSDAGSVLLTDPSLEWSPY